MCLLSIDSLLLDCNPFLYTHWLLGVLPHSSYKWTPPHAYILIHMIICTSAHLDVYAHAHTLEKCPSALSRDLKSFVLCKALRLKQNKVKPMAIFMV